MLIERLTIEGLHGFLSRDIKFQPGVNLLVGINGSGKTSVLNALAWSLSPLKLQDGVVAGFRLASMNFAQISVSYSEKGRSRPRTLMVTQNADSMALRLSGITKVLDIPHARPERRFIGATRGLVSSDDDAAFVLTRSRPTSGTRTAFIVRPPRPCTISYSLFGRAETDGTRTSIS